MAMIGKVLRMHRRDNKSVREIAQATSLARNTVRKYLRAEGVEERRRYRRPAVPSKLAPFVEAIKQRCWSTRAGRRRNDVQPRRCSSRLAKRVMTAVTRGSRTSSATGGYSKAA